ncbi:MAG: hypothetical protein U9N46_02975 [Euryarchaeota archaeon]|nr:hypothetical protein [Euryarchaeota archaeon]
MNSSLVFIATLLRNRLKNADAMVIDPIDSIDSIDPIDPIDSFTTSREETSNDGLVG